MKKIYYLIAMAMMAFTFTSCEDVPEPFGQPINPNSGSSTTVDPAGSGTATDPYNVAGVIDYVKGLGADVVSPNDVYVSGIITEVTAAFVNDNYGNATFRIGDTENAKTTFYAYRCLYFGKAKYTDPTATNIKVGDKVVICGKVINYKGTTPETQQNDAYVVSINGQGGESGGGESGGGESGGGETGENLLANGDFEAWTGSAADNWNGVTGNGTFEKSTTAHGGSAALLFKGSSSANKRLAYKEIKLKAGTYTLTAYAKAATETKASLRPGYAKLTNGAVADSKNDYKYGNYTNDITNADWATVSHSFTLTEETSLNILFMNPKSTAADVILDDVTLTTSDGGIIDGGESGGGESGGGETGSAYLDESFANGKGNFTIEDKVFTGVWTAGSYGSDKYMMATSFVKADGEDAKTNHDAESWLISPEINLSSATNPVLTFAQVINKYFGTIADEAMVYAKKEGGEWTKLTITYPATPSGSFSKFTDEGANVTVSLANYKSAKTQIAFVYKGTATKAGTWEIKDVKVAEAQ